MGYCCIPSCKSGQSKGISFHKFPTNIENKRLWIKVISQQGNPRSCHWTPKGRSTICSRHFTDSDFSISTTKKILLPSAVPSIFDDMVGRKKARRSKSNDSADRQNRTRKTSLDEITSDKEPDPPIESETRKQSSVKIKCSKNDKNLKIRKSKRCLSGPVGNDAPNIDTSTSVDENSVSAPVEKPESAKMLPEDNVSDCATSSMSDDLSDSDWEGIESSIELAPPSSTVKITKSLQSVLRKLVTTIENQRSEISKLKRERDLLSQEIYKLTQKDS